MKDYILFDLDGTLTNPAEGITNSVAYALSHYGITVGDKSTLNVFIGPPLTDSFVRYYGFSEEKAKEAVEVYREYFAPKGIFENKLYYGVPEMLSELKKHGRKILLATSKPEIFAKKILLHFGISEYFDYVAGSELDHKRVDKHEVIEYVLSLAGISDRSRCVMVGDRSHDIKGGKKSSLDTVGVLYGFGDKAELEEAGADHIAADTAELTSLLLTL